MTGPQMAASGGRLYPAVRHLQRRSMLPFGYFGPASWRTLIVVSTIALIVASLFCYLIIWAAETASA